MKTPNIDTMLVLLASIAFIGSFMLICLFAIPPKIDYSNMVFTVVAFLASGRFLWAKI